MTDGGTVMDPSTPQIVVLGDPIAALAGLRASRAVHRPAADRTVEHIRCAVIGVDLTGVTTRRDIRRTLQNRMALSVPLCLRLPGLAQLIVVTGGAAPGMEAWVQGAGEASSRRAQALVEQSCGAFVSVTVVVADSCADVGLLAERIVRRARRAPGIDASIALTWDELAADSDGLAGAHEYL